MQMNSSNKLWHRLFNVTCFHNSLVLPFFVGVVGVVDCILFEVLVIVGLPIFDIAL